MNPKADHSDTELDLEAKHPEEVTVVPESQEYTEYIELNEKYQGKELQRLTVCNLVPVHRRLLVRC
jgi:hypothetical protein